MTVEALVTVGDERVRVTSIGSGHPILVLAGANGAEPEISASLARLADIARLVSYDETADTGNDASEPDFDRAASEIETLRVALGLGDVVVFGHSGGVLVAAEYARRWPHHVAGLVLCLAGVDIADPLAEIAAPALVIATAHPIEIADILRPWLEAEIVAVAGASRDWQASAKPDGGQ